MHFQISNIYFQSIKKAFMHFQYAAWPFQHIRDKMNSQRFDSVDFEKDNLTFFVNALLVRILKFYGIFPFSWKLIFFLALRFDCSRKNVDNFESEFWKNA